MAVYGSARVWHGGGTGVEAQRAPIRILHDFLDIIRNIIRNVRKDMRKEIRIRILLGYHDSIRHAQAKGLARRIQSAAELRSRHRAWQSAICSQDDWVLGPSFIMHTRKAGDQF